MMKKTPERQLDVLIQDGLRLLEPTEGTATDYDCVVLTQMLGQSIRVRVRVRVRVNSDARPVY